ncbi:M14 metallopeptidase family protein [Aureibaculum sp. 2210JD6-5]|uniref:M14 family metallopeptidase n=1 Tax=Aureibaculum sp. 2210JD6-5 TaxID=3103957 RepID=UPI002AAEC0DC|nr:M14 metallopeptidase family protein [Aureibaculum sp. 2210JD6-5]MDY7395017.1 M14 metallopeptidase family protein [Aureibaculum sp. 2210JD6-5]
MKLKALLILITLFCSEIILGQSDEMTSNLYNTYNKFKEPSLDKRRIKHSDIKPLIEKFRKNPKFTVNKVGQSIEGRDLSLISIGTGKTNVFLWSQMHGDEPTATQAIFDILNFLDSDDFSKEKKKILNKLTLHFLPMLNPDGAEEFTRRNALGIDINRDALRLQSPEGQTLKRVRDSLNADFGFNLHDQSTYYNAERTEKPATISYLAPAYNYEKEINEVRGNAMKVIVFMNNIIQKYASGQVGRYNDDFEPRAFGDNITKWGTSAILIESGGYPNDVEKQEIRKLNYVSILSAIYTIANGDYKDIPIEDYNKIPENDRKLFDLKLKNLTYNVLGKDYTIDLGINRLEVDNKENTDFYNVGRIVDQGDLSTYYGYETFDAGGYKIVEGTLYPSMIPSITSYERLNELSMLKKGYVYVKMAKLPDDKNYTDKPIMVLKVTKATPELNVRVGANPTFLLEKNGKIDYAVINGFLIDLNAENPNFKNGLIYK